MATSGELRAIIEDLELVDIGDAANYLGEEAIVDEEYVLTTTTTLFMYDSTESAADCKDLTCQAQSA